MIQETHDRPKYFTREDLESHCTSDSAYVSVYNTVFDVSDPIAKHFRTKGAENLLRHAGKDISHFFHHETKQPIIKNAFLRETIQNRSNDILLHFEENVLDSKPKNKETPWFVDSKNMIGILSANEVTIRIVNTLTFDEDFLIVPVEESLNEICKRYLKFNYHAKSYTWKDIEHRKLKMEKTLEQNGILEDNLLMDYLNIPEKQRPVSSVFLHFNDDLTDL